MNKKTCHFLVLLAFNLGNLSLAEANPPPLECNLQPQLRKLWEDHITWSHSLLVSVAAKLPDQTAVLERRLRTPDAIGNTLKPYYGAEAARKVAALLTQNIQLETEVLNTLANKETARAAETTGRWYTNLDDLAQYLSRLNPQHWPLDHFREMFREHLDNTSREFVTYLAQDWAESIRSYDNLHSQILHVADHLAEGIQKQFPERFEACQKPQDDDHGHGH